jgi:hypothetical protein
MTHEPALALAKIGDVGGATVKQTSSTGCGEADGGQWRIRVNFDRSTDVLN